MWRVAAIESRPTEGAAPPFESSRAPAPRVSTTSANKRMSHLAGWPGEEESLTTRSFENPFARASPLAVEGGCARSLEVCLSNRLALSSSRVT